jgi:hypothetical protein
VDYIAGHDRSDKMTVLLGRKRAASRRARPSSGLLESGAILIDIDGDGKLDLLASQRGYHPTKRMILRNDGDLKFTPGDVGDGTRRERGQHHGVGDLNGDGSPDPVCIEGKTFVAYFNDGKGHFTAKPDALQGQDKLRNKPHYTNWGGAVLADLDNDGIPDLLLNGRNFFLRVPRPRGGTYAAMNEAWGIPDGAWSAVDEGLFFGDVNGTAFSISSSVRRVRRARRRRRASPERPSETALAERPRCRTRGQPAGGRLTDPDQPDGRRQDPPLAGAGRDLGSTELPQLLWRGPDRAPLRPLATARRWTSRDLPPSGKKIEKKGVKADATIVFEEDP